MNNFQEEPTREQSPVDFKSPDPKNSQPAWKKWIVPVAASVALLLGLFALLEARSAKDDARSAQQASIQQVSDEQRQTSQRIADLQKEMDKQAAQLRAQGSRTQQSLRADIKKEIARTNKVGAEAERVQREAVRELESEIDDLDNRTDRLERQVASLEDKIRQSE